jgi:hypothetical protein
MNHFTIRKTLLGTLLGLQIFGFSANATVHTIDVLGIYPDEVAQRVADPVALIVSNIEYANRALQNSGANYRYQLVHVQQHNWTDSHDVGSSQLIALQQDAEANSLREEYGADLVAGLAKTSSWCGIGYLPSANPNTHTFYYWASRYGFSLSGDTCGGRTMAHEMGHTMGLGHSHAQDSEGTVATWGRGHGEPYSFVTVMAYQSAYGVSGTSGRLQIHSNPDLYVCKSQSCGRPIDQAGAAHATLALNLAAPQVAEWMPTVVSLPQNNPPIAEDDAAIVDEGDSVSISVLANDSDPDGDPLSIGIKTAPQNGSAVVSGAEVFYTPGDGFVGLDSFVYELSDGHDAADATVEVQVNALPESAQDPENLAINGDVEAGLQSWAGWWGTSVALSEEALSGAASINAIGGRGVVVDLAAPFSGGQNLGASGTLASTGNNRVYVYFRLLQGGVWRYWYLTGLNLYPGAPAQFDASRYISTSSEVEGGVLLFYMPYGISGQLRIDDVRVDPR